MPTLSLNSKSSGFSSVLSLWTLSCSVPVFTPDVMALGHFRLIDGSKVAVGVSMKANGCLSLCCLCDGWQMAAHLRSEEHE